MIEALDHLFRLYFALRFSQEPLALQPWQPILHLSPYPDRCDCLLAAQDFARLQEVPSAFHFQSFQAWLVDLQAHIGPWNPNGAVACPRDSARRCLGFPLPLWASSGIVTRETYQELSRGFPLRIQLLDPQSGRYLEDIRQLLFQVLFQEGDSMN